MTLQEVINYWEDYLREQSSKFQHDHEMYRKDYPRWQFLQGIKAVLASLGNIK